MAYTNAIFLTATGAGNWTAPDDFNWLDNQIITKGAGGGGTSQSQYRNGGAGGACSYVTNRNIHPGDVVPFSIGAGGGPAAAGGDTWIGHASYASSFCAAKGASAASTGAYAAAQGGQASAGIGDVKYSGGNGGPGGSTVLSGGGGGAAGPNGNGGNGATGVNGSLPIGGGGGGGADGGTNASGGTHGTGANGGGNGGDGGVPGGAGSPGTEWDASHGSGGGGGGGHAQGGTPPGANGGAGGGYGGGGGGAGNTYGTTMGTPGSGAQGLIIILYNPRKSIVCEMGSFALTGQDARLAAQRAISAAAGVYALSGQDIVWRYWHLFAETGYFTLTGLQTGAWTGIFTLTGQDASLRRDYRLRAGTRQFSLTGSPAALSWSGYTTPDFSILTAPANKQIFDPKTGAMRTEWKLFFQAVMEQTNAFGNSGEQ